MSDDPKPRAAFATSTTPLRDKDNAAPAPRPTYARSNNPTLAPSGSTGLRPTMQTQNLQKQQVRPTPHPGNDNTKRDLWIDGKITTMPGYTFQAKLEDEPSHQGIEGGRISNLEVSKNGHQVMRYDRGWDQKPRTTEQKEALHRIRNGLGDTRRKEFKGFAADKSNSKGMER